MSALRTPLKSGNLIPTPLRAWLFNVGPADLRISCRGYFSERLFVEPDESSRFGCLKLLWPRRGLPQKV